MKKIFFVLSAIALFGLASCVDQIDKSKINPTFNPETNEVLTNFVFNVSTSNTPTTKMSAANTQATLSEDFRGIESASLLTFKLGVANDGKHVSANTQAADKKYDLATVLTAGYLDPDGSVPQSRRVLEISLPTETNALMFWGKAIKDGTDNQEGAIEWNMDKNLANISFTLKKRIESGSGPKQSTAFGQYEAVIAAVMNKIINTTKDYDVTFGGTQYTGTIKWSDYITVDATTTPMTLVAKTKSPVTTTLDIAPLEEILAKTFVQMNTIYANEVRAGSGNAVAYILSDLNAIVSTMAATTTIPNTKEEAIAQQLADQISTNITAVIDASSSSWKALSNAKTFSALAAADIALVTEDINGFPKTIFGVPNGAATMNFTIGGTDPNYTFTYAYNAAIPTYAMNGASGGSFDVLNYRYPAELCYFGNSPIRVTDDSHIAGDYPDGVANWDNDGSWAAGQTGAESKAWTKNGHVLSSTRSVAMQENINYGTALLKTTIKYGVASLKDNNAAIQQARTGATEQDATIDATAAPFTCTGILIGGVEETMGWNYIAKATTPTFSSFIYDPDMPSTAIPAFGSGYSVPNYTLVWDNWNAASIDAKQNVVYVALEFVNNSGKDFWGMNNLIRKGATFYIPGKLDPNLDYGTGSSPLSTTDFSAGITWPTKYALPPYAADGSTIQQRRIFIQDYMTTASFVIGEDSLKAALVAVPDLRSSQISLGLSVDLQWQTGLVFNDVILGAN